MKIIRKTRLRFTEGKSDKVYEVDLCEIPQGDHYVVNFRYGRYGSNLREGTKTSSPVTIGEATKIFDSLVVSKTNKGYVDITSGGKSTASAAKNTDNESTSSTREAILKTILEYLDEPPSHWPISRIAWRIGELELTEACDKLAAHAGSNNQQLNYAIAWSLGRCGNARHLDTITHLQASKNADVSRIANEAFLRLAPEQSVDQAYSKLLASLPKEVRKSIEENRKDQLFIQLDSILVVANQSNISLLETLYSLALKFPQVHDVLCRLLRVLPITREHYFKAIRHIYKISEMRADGIVYGLITLRMAMSPSGGWRQPFQATTKHYMSQRSWRALKRLGAADSDQYVPMAAGILLAMADEHAGEDKTVSQTQWNWQTNQSEVISQTHYGRYADFFALNNILYTHSQQYRPLNSKKAWHKVSDQKDQARTEAFPELWDNAPETLLDLLIKSRCDIVHHFASKALKDNERYCNQISSQAISTLLASIYETTADFALQLAKSKYNANSPDTALIAACFNSPYEPARDQAVTWIEADSSILKNDLSLYALALSNMHEPVRQGIALLIPSIALSTSEQDALLAKIVQHISAIPEGISNNNVKAVVELLEAHFSHAVHELDMNVLSVLFDSEHPSIQLFAGLLLLLNKVKLDDISEHIIDVINQSGDDDMQGVAVELLNKHEESYLLEHKDLLFSHCVSSREAVREAVKPIIGRLASNNQPFATSLLHDVIAQLFKREPFDGLHTDLIAMASMQLKTALKHIDTDQIWRLVNAKSKGAQALGSICLGEVRKTSFSIRQWVNFASNPTLATRQWAMDAYNENISLVKDQPSDALRILSSKWEDSRAFAIEFFREHFAKPDWSPKLIIHLCDSMHDDVQRFGRELMTEFFEHGDGEEYLTKLSQHPSRNVQLFTTNYLEQYAGGNADNIRRLHPYFLRVLSNVYKGRIAKDRVCRFLLNEALQSKDVARLVGEIFDRQSVTLCISDKAAYIEGMHAIHMKFPDLDLPIEITPLSIKSNHEQEAKHGV